MHDILNEESKDKFTVIYQIKDDAKMMELKIEDEEEDFLDEATVNHTYSDCPYALKMVAGQVCTRTRRQKHVHVQGCLDSRVKYSY